MQEIGAERPFWGHGFSSSILGLKMSASPDLHIQAFDSERLVPLRISASRCHAMLRLFQKMKELKINLLLKKK